MERFFRILLGTFLFWSFCDFISLRGQSSPISQPPDTICETVKGFDLGMCLSAGDGNPSGPLGDRIPVIFIHGWDPKNVPGEPDLLIWRGLATHLFDSYWFQENYKMYFLWYLSNIQNIRDMGLTFRFLIDRMDQIDPAFGKKPLVLVGHSMGGLIARSYMKEFKRGSGELNGNRVLRLITLGTPHHGSPFANGPARDVKAGLDVFLLHQFVDGGLFGYNVRWDMDNRYDLHWDNYDGLLDYESFPENSLWMEWLNSGETFENKIMVYGGRVSLSGQISNCILKAEGSACLTAIMNQTLGISESDGFVPLSSAIFEPCKNCLATRVYPDYDHKEIAGGKSYDDPIFWDIAGNLLSLITPRYPDFDSYADLGNPDDERFHQLSGWGRINSTLLPKADTDRTSRYQSLRGQNSVVLSVPEILTPYRLTFRSEDGYCDDSFDVFVNNNYVYGYDHREPPSFPINSVRVPAELISDSRVRVTFRNLSRDNCGLAAIYYVRLDRLESNQPYQSCSYSFSPSRIQASSRSQTITVQVIAGDSCLWEAATAEPWIKLLRLNGTGTGSLSFELDRNYCDGLARTGAISILGSDARLEVYQDGTDLGYCP